MTKRRVIVHIDEVVIDADPGADLAALESEVRSGIAAAFLAGTPRAFARSAPVLTADHRGLRGIGGAIANAAPPPRRAP
jgi:hypothetical protein